MDGHGHLMYFGAYVATASILGGAGGAVADASPLQALLIGVLGASIPVGLAAWFGRKKAGADVSRQLTDAASELVKQYRIHDLELEARLTIAEKAATTALLAEADCRRRLSKLEEKVMALHPIGEPTPPASTTTTTVQVTHP